jgi:hypothetical protein
MTKTTYARLAGFVFLLYIATGIASMVLFRQATGGAVPDVAKLQNIVQNVATVRLTMGLTLLTFVDAVVLAVALFALTREQDQNLAVMALCFRVTEGVIAAVSIVRTLALLSVATAAAGATVAEAAAANALGALLLKMGGWTGAIAAISFALGSTLYCYLFLRARTIPVSLAWLGVASSILLVVALPLQLTRVMTSPIGEAIWLPMLVFEVTFALWLLIKGWPAEQGRRGEPNGSR